MYVCMYVYVYIVGLVDVDDTAEPFVLVLVNVNGDGCRGPLVSVGVRQDVIVYAAINFAALPVPWHGRVRAAPSAIPNVARVSWIGRVFPSCHVGVGETICRNVRQHHGPLQDRKVSIRPRRSRRGSCRCTSRNNC